VFIVFTCIRCTTNHHQQKFRRQALSEPAGIQAMTDGGKHKSGSKSDPSDWRTAPNFSGLFEVITPAYPNPVSYNSTLKILISVRPNAINELKIYVFRQPADFRLASPIQIIPQTLQSGLHTFKIKPSQFAAAGGTGNFGNIYRI